MVRDWKMTVRADEGLNRAVLLFWFLLITLSIIITIIFSCAGGASKDESSPTRTGAGCGGCGG
ncbi:hypothetical protein K2173_000263 [Erythroxylum novogranatense]|uniref:Transmembrane protein n=1 Tax=Erythroxylum novogranatense TaxID=1862640 RepID=A0AAV8SVS5_9ROSI|nr:hypothetical protein K2173_000263 [Erythroxylum novogranatense]